MKSILVAIFLSAAVSFAVATWVNKGNNPPSPVASELEFDASLAPDDRLAVLERAVSQERLARQLLQEEVIILTDELAALRDAEAIDNEPIRAERRERPTEAEIESRREFFARRNSPEGRIERFVAAGLAPSVAEWILQREEELQMESLQARFEAGRSGDPADFNREQFSTNDVLRQELGDADYERYLEANGRQTSIGVSSVIGSSPAETAGLRPGDQITRYAGERVFSMTDINKATMAGEPGQSVVLDIVRDGVAMQIVIPRGPLGITGGRSRR